MTNKLPVARLLILGLIFHLVYIGTVFDCYFTSPVVNGMKSYGERPGPAKRLVLIVGDGLRADLLMSRHPFPNVPDSPEIVAPYLREIVEKRGAFGVSHTRVPTESRPGHVALIGGMYEDVSAVTKGWKTNPVDFDSVFNQSSHTYSFGSPDILPMFAHGATLGKVDMWCYHEDEEDFTKDATALDTWVLAQLRTLIHNATTDAALNFQLRQDRTVFFLHLLGLDTTGHSYRPHSKEYMNNIQVVDDIVQKTEALMNEFYGDSETAYVFTADHGMSVIGNHGDGDPDNTRTPLILWGAGVRGPLPDTSSTSHDDYSLPWGLSHLYRRDVEQADVTALMSALLGVNWPVNSVGVLPDVDHTGPGYLTVQDDGKGLVELALTNAQVVLEHYRIKHENKRAHALRYKPFSYFAKLSEHEDSPGALVVSEIEQHIEAKRYNDARQAAATLIKHSLEGLRYLETYDRLLIGVIVTAAYLGWIAYCAVAILQQAPVDRSILADVAAGTVLTAFWSLFAIERSPATFYVYILFPVYFWHSVLSRIGPFLGQAISKPSRFWLAFAFRAAVVIAALESMVVAYMHRSIWSVGFVAIGVVWPMVSWDSKLRSKHAKLLLTWSTVCLVTAVFPLLSVNKEESIPTIVTGGLFMLAAGIIGYVAISNGADALKGANPTITVLQCALILVTIVITASSASNLQQKLGLPLINQVGGWIVLVAASILPFAQKQSNPAPLAKIATLFLGFSVCFVILSISSEGLFYFFFSATLLVWVEVESVFRQSHMIKPSTQKSKAAAPRTGYVPQADDLRIAVFFLFFVQVGFFGTGNVASISSFYLEPVYRLIPVFSPFLMAALLIFKIVAPYIILAAFFALLNARLHLPPFSLFLIALTLTDVMTLTFFFKVTDTGSWLEIGQTISFFCVSSLLLVWSAGICAVGEALMAGTTFDTTTLRRKGD